MATAKIRLEKSRLRKNGTYPVVFQVIHHRKKKVIYSPYHLREECFNSEKGLAVNRKHYRIPKLQEINNYLSSGLENLHQIIDYITVQKPVNRYRSDYLNHNKRLSISIRTRLLTFFPSSKSRMSLSTNNTKAVLENTIGI
jgi:hypothetical protein